MSLLESMRNLWVHGRDSTGSFLLQHFLQHKFSNYGRMLQVSINSREKKAHFELHLKGEPDSFTITIQEYELIHEEAGSFVIVKKASSTKPWINSVIADFVIDKKIPVPDKFANVLKLAL